jgi:hypothetical protein
MLLQKRLHATLFFDRQDQRSRWSLRFINSTSRTRLSFFVSKPSNNIYPPFFNGPQKIPSPKYRLLFFTRSISSFVRSFVRSIDSLPSKSWLPFYLFCWACCGRSYFSLRRNSATTAAESCAAASSWPNNNHDDGGEERRASSQAKKETYSRVWLLARTVLYD